MTSALDQRRTELVKLFHNAPIAKTYGMTLSYDESGSAIFDLPYNPGFDHGLGGIHGGVFATMLDNAGWFTIAPHYENWIATVDFNVQLLEAVAKTGLKARGQLIRLGKTLSVAQMEVKTVDGKLVATGSGTFTATSVPFRAGR